MKNNREFNDILEICLERLMNNGEPIEQCLNDYPQHADELRPLLETTVTARQALAIQPRPEFKTSARYQFQSALQGFKPKKSLPFFTWQPQWAMAVVIILAVLFTGGGTVAAAGRSMPDSPLYPIKLITEQVQLALTTSTISKAKLYAKLADKRVAEIVYVANSGKSEQIVAIAQRLNRYLTLIASLPLAEGAVKTALPEEAPALLAPQPKATLKEAPVRALSPAPPAPRSPQPDQAGKGKPPAPAIAPPPPRPAEIKTTPGTQPDTPRGKLKILLKRNSVNHPEALRAVLDKIPDSAKPALRMAIELSSSSYNKAIDALD